MSDPGSEAIARVKAAGKDYYKVLGVDKKADEAAIKKAYRKLALILHPDKCKLDGAEEAFKSVSAAYNCLSQQSSRSTYDMTGEEGPAGMGGGGGHPFAHADAEEIFRQFFAQNGGGGFGGFPGGGFPGGGGQTFFFSTNGMGPGFSFGSGGLGGNPFFDLRNLNRHQSRRRQGGGQRGSGTDVNTNVEQDDDEQEGFENAGPTSIDQLLPSWAKPLIAVLQTVSKVIPTQVLILIGVIGGSLLFRVILQAVLARLMYVIAIFTLAPQRFRWRLLFALIVLHFAGILP